MIPPTWDATAIVLRLAVGLAIVAASLKGNYCTNTSSASSGRMKNVQQSVVQ